MRTAAAMEAWCLRAALHVIVRPIREDFLVFATACGCMQFAWGVSLVAAPSQFGLGGSALTGGLVAAAALVASMLVLIGTRHLFAMHIGFVTSAFLWLSLAAAHTLGGFDGAVALFLGASALSGYAALRTLSSWIDLD